jgi:hypothetical protein
MIGLKRIEGNLANLKSKTFAEAPLKMINKCSQKTNNRKGLLIIQSDLFVKKRSELEFGSIHILTPFLITVATKPKTR